MQKRDKFHQRSVAIQSPLSFDNRLKSGSLSKRLCKKAGFRNLLQKSVIVVHRESVQRSEIGRTASQSVQASLGIDHCLNLNRFRGNLDSNSSDFRSASKAKKVIDGIITGSNPGTSNAASTALDSLSFTSQRNDAFKRSHEGSLAVVYNYGEKSSPDSRSSNLFFYGSQGSRRFSDETVLLIEDYQSYDYLNAAGRQESNSSYQRQRFFSCCRKKNLRYANPLARPIPISFDAIDENDETLVCRICHEGETFEPLLEPCLCKGSVGCVHARCLKIWLEQSNTSRCELCNYPYAIRQNKRYSKKVSIKVYFGTVIDKRSLIYDAISFVVITPLTIVGVAMCIQASVFSTAAEDASDTNFHMGNITKAGMIMLSATIMVAYGVWLYTLISYHFKMWKKWYGNCYDVEVLPVRMTSEERVEAYRKLNEELSRRQTSREGASTTVSVLRSPNSASYSFYPRAISVGESAR